MALGGSRKYGCASWLPQAPPRARRKQPHPAPRGLRPRRREEALLPLQPERLFRMASFEEVCVSGFEEFMKAVEQHKDKTIFAYFTGSKDSNGESWCPDCVQGELGIQGSCPAEVAGWPEQWPEMRV